MSGWNSSTGHDPSVAAPAGAPRGFTVRSQDEPFIPRMGGPAHGYAMGQQMYTHPQAGQGYVVAGAAAGGPQFTYTQQPSGAGNYMYRQPQATPHIDPSVPALNFTNTTGGVGCEPGYNYWFSPTNTKIHFFQSSTAPWHLPPTSQIPFKALHVPTSITFGELFKGTGCTNPTPKKNRIYEVISAGGGRWYKGLEVTGADKDMLKRPIRDVGWDETRSGHSGEKPVVCLWACKD